MELSLGLYCEGASEARIIHHIIEKYLGDDCTIEQEEPKIVKGKQDSPGGWENVLRHCTEDEIKAILSLNDYLVIQIDTDTCEHPNYGVALTDKNGKEKDHQELYEDVCNRIVRDLGADFIKEYSGKIIFAVCINEIECWLLPVYYTDKNKCSTNNCIHKLNKKLSPSGFGIPETNKNSDGAKKAYSEILSNLRKKNTIKSVSKHNYGFNKFIEQLDNI